MLFYYAHLLQFPWREKLIIQAGCSCLLRIACSGEVAVSEFGRPERSNQLFLPCFHHLSPSKSRILRIRLLSRVDSALPTRRGLTSQFNAEGAELGSTRERQGNESSVWSRNHSVGHGNEQTSHYVRPEGKSQHLVISAATHWHELELRRETDSLNRTSVFD